MSEEFRNGEPGGEKEGGESGHFMTQTITGRKDRGERLARLVGRAALAGIIFSAAAAATAAVLLPRLGLKLPAGEESTARVRIEGTEESGTQETEAGSAAETSAAAESAAAAESSAAAGSAAGHSTEGPAAGSGTRAERETPAADAVSQAVQDAMEGYPYSMKDFLKITGNLRAAAEKADLSVVSVNHVREGTDWFENDVQTSGTFSGLAVAKTPSEVLILTTEKAARGADVLTVSLPKGVTAEASVKRLDSMSGLAVLSVPVTDETKDAVSALEPVSAGSSARVRRGDFLIAAGAPAGILHSLGYGVVTALRQGVGIVDRTVSVIYTDAGGSASAGTWILNTDGELVGWVTDTIGGVEAGNTAVLGISDFGGLLEHMINGQASPYIGIRGTAVIPSAQEQGVPAGVYVSEVAGESPAFEAGIQPGDVITRVGDSKITTMRDFSKKLETLHAQDIVSVTVMRNGREEYTGIDFQVTVGAR